MFGSLMSTTEYQLVDTQAVFDEILDELSRVDRYAVDTEFHRERTYYPRLALVQIGWADEVVVVDPLAVDISGLRSILEGPATAVMHACGQDLEVLARACDAIPARIFDTQVAAGFIGMRSPSLASLHDQLLGVRLPKGDRLTDWFQRPLADGQLRYAAGDVDNLLAIHTVLLERLEELGRTQWANDECEIVRNRDLSPRAPEDAWRRIKEARSLRGKAMGSARGIAAWRERRAQSLDQPPRYILSDLAVVSLAQRLPKTVDSFSGIRGLDERQLKEPDRLDIIASIEESLAQPVQRAESRQSSEVDRDLRPAVSLVAAWLSQFAADERLDPALVGSRADIESLLRGDQGARLSSGWRRDLAGERIEALVGGRGALAFDGRGRLVLESRSGESLSS